MRHGRVMLLRKHPCVACLGHPEPQAKDLAREAEVPPLRCSENSWFQHPPSPRPSALRLPPGYVHPPEADRTSMKGCAPSSTSVPSADPPTRGLRTRQEPAAAGDTRTAQRKDRAGIL